MIILKTKIVLCELSVADMEIFMAISKVISGAEWVHNGCVNAQIQAI